MYRHLEAGFAAISLVNDYEHGKQLYQKGKKQIFYFDDFMGSTFLGDKIASTNADVNLLDFIQIVRRSPTAKLILTTREHLLQQAIDRSEKIRNSTISDYRCVLELRDYSFRQRAAILYNHLYFSDLPPEYKDVLLDEDFYLQVIRHEKFNPRLIEWLSSYRRVQNVPPGQYRVFVANLLRDPSEIWKYAYEYQISDAARSLLLALYSLQGRVAFSHLEIAFSSIHEHRAQKYQFSRKPEDFHRAFRELSGAFIKTTFSTVELINPSLIDLLNTIISESPGNAIDIVASAVQLEQVARIWRLASDRADSALRDSIAKSSDSFERTFRVLLSIDSGRSEGSSSLEGRLQFSIELVEAVRSSKLRELLRPFAEAILERWKSNEADIGSAIDALLAMKTHLWASSKFDKDFQSAFLKGIVLSAVRGCSSIELMKVIEIARDLGISAESNSWLRTAYESFLADHFTSELVRCRSTGAFEKLSGTISEIGSLLNIRVDVQLNKIQVEADDFENHQSDYDDHIYDEWKDQRWQDREDENSVRDMFGSLRKND
jgi:hypothetical protein